MAQPKVQEKIIAVLRSAKSDLSLNDLVNQVRPNTPSGRNEVKAAVVPLLHRGQIQLTPARKFSIGS